jgi:hypothetical protein
MTNFDLVLQLSLETELGIRKSQADWIMRNIQV